MRSGDVQPLGELGATFDAAMEFGLDEKEVWATIIEVCRASPGDEEDDPLEELSAALARRILAGIRHGAA